MDAALEETHTRMYAFLRWRADRKHISESLEHLASYNRADMYKYNMLYTLNVNWHVLTFESEHKYKPCYAPIINNFTTRRQYENSYYIG